MAKGQNPSAHEPVDARLLQIAAQHIRLHGVGRTTIVGIAEAAGMSHANVYRYFPSKAALFEALGDRWLKPVEARLRQIADGPDPADDKLERLAMQLHRAYRDKIEAEPEIFAIFVDSVSRDRAGARRHRSRVRQELQQVVEDGLATGVFNAADPRRAVLLTLDLLYRFIHPAAVWQDREASRDQVFARLERVSVALRRALAAGVK